MRERALGWTGCQKQAIKVHELSVVEDRDVLFFLKDVFAAVVRLGLFAHFESPLSYFTAITTPTLLNYVNLINQSGLKAITLFFPALFVSYISPPHTCFPAPATDLKTCFFLVL